MCLAKPVLTLRAFVADQRNFRHLMGMEIANYVRSPISITDYADSDHKAPLELAAPESSPARGGVTGVWMVPEKVCVHCADGKAGNAASVFSVETATGN